MSPRDMLLPKPRHHCHPNGPQDSDSNGSGDDAGCVDGPKDGSFSFFVLDVCVSGVVEEGHEKLASGEKERTVHGGGVRNGVDTLSQCDSKVSGEQNDRE